jgi:DNA-binding MarR family transcriptional regulator
VTWSPLLALQRATHHTLDLLGEQLSGLGLTAAELNVLATLADGQPRTVSQLADDVGSKPTTMTSVLDRLARRELVTRRAHPTNRRSVVIRLTTPGAAAAEAVRIAVTELESDLLEGLSPELLAGLRTGLEQLGGRPR